MAGKHIATRRTMTIVFADVAGFGAMREGEVQTFSSTVLPRCTELASKHGTAYCNTWGDAIVAYFDSVDQALSYALELRDMFRAGRSDSTNFGNYKTPLAVRISMHTADVFLAEDTVTPGGKIYGTQVSLAARIEPITAPNEVFASEVVISALKTAGRDDIKTKKLGKLPLPKENRKETIYWVGRENETARRPSSLLKPPPMRTFDKTEQVVAEIAKGPPIKSLKVLSLNGGSSMHSLLGMAESHLASKATVSILIFDPDCTQLMPPRLVDDTSEKYLLQLKEQLPDSNGAEAACEYLMQASEITAWSNDSQDAQTSRLRERLSTCVRNAKGKNISVKLAKSPRWVPARCWLVDDRAYVTNYWQPNALSPIMAVEKRDPIYEAVRHHFDYVWEEAEQLSGSMLFEATSKGAKRSGRRE